jgi:hypothetical protein
MNNWYPSKYHAAGSAENAVLKGEKCRLGYMSANSVNGAACYVKLYDKLAAPAATDTPVVVFYLPVTTGQFTFPLPNDGLLFKNGLGIRIVTEQADNGTTGVTAAAVVVNYAIG